MVNEDLKNRCLDFIKGLDVNDPMELRYSFNAAVREWESTLDSKKEVPPAAPEEPERIVQEVKVVEKPAPAEEPPETPQYGQPPQPQDIKKMFFDQLKQVAAQLTSAGKEAFSQMKGIQKEFKDKVKYSDGEEGKKPEDEKRDEDPQKTP